MVRVLKNSYCCSINLPDGFGGKPLLACIDRAELFIWLTSVAFEVVMKGDVPMFLTSSELPTIDLSSFWEVSI